MLVPITSDLHGYALFWDAWARRLLLMLGLSMGIIILLLVLILLTLWWKL